VSNGFVKSKKDLFELMEKFEQSELSELTLEVDEQLIMMKKEGAHGAVVVPHSVPAPVSTTAAPAVSASAPSAEQEGELISAPLVGTFYRQAAPDAPPFVEPGTKIKAGDTLCILEAMKIMNELEAEFDCEILEVLLDSGSLAEFGTPLYRVKRL
jgi:acetyl-CoA carboxylase biotin carboxyl carrier protein